MRVAIVCPYALDVPGGVQGQSIGLAEALARRGHVVTLLAPGAKGLLREGVSVLPLGATRGVPANGSRAPIALSPTVVPRLARALAGGGFEVVHLEEPFVPLCSLASLFLARAPLIGTFHRAGAGRVYRAMRPALQRAALHLSARVAVSAAANATLSAVTGTEAEMILNNAIDLARFSPQMSLPGRRRIAFVGRHERRKGLAVLLEAFTRLSGELELLVVGSGPESGALRAAYPDPRVRWLGRLDDAGVARTLAEAEIFCAPALGGESFGVVLLEAMAAGCAVVASDLAGFREAAGGAARYTPVGDVAALRAALARLLAEPDALASLAEEGRHRAAGHSFEALAASYERLYDAVLS